MKLFCGILDLPNHFSQQKQDYTHVVFLFSDTKQKEGNSQSLALHPLLLLPLSFCHSSYQKLILIFSMFLLTKQSLNYLDSNTGQTICANTHTSSKFTPFFIAIFRFHMTCMSTPHGAKLSLDNIYLKKS